MKQPLLFQCVDQIFLFFFSALISFFVCFFQCGDQLLQMSAADLEAKLGLKNPLHRKKLRLAMRAKMETSTPSSLVGAWKSW
jgi:hypothetical protein